MNKQDNINIVLCGVGGQGTILASRLISAAAMKKGLHVRSAETIGLIIAFEPAEAVRMLPFLKEGGSAVVSMRPIRPVSAMIGMSAYPEEEILSFLKEQVSGLILVDSEKAAAELGSSKCLNVVLLGAAARSGALGLAEEELLAAIRERLPAKLHELNARALRYRSM